MKKKKDWILVANSVYADIFEIEGKKLSKIEHIKFPEGRLKGSEILSDRPGRGFESMGSGARHALSSEVDPHTHEQQVFAHNIANLLTKAKDQNRFEQLHLIVPPIFLGILRDIFSDHLQKCIYQEIAKEIPEGASENERIALIYKYLNVEKISGENSPWKKEVQKGAH